MQLTYKTYLNKVKACFIGKNIGGTLGAPFEGKRGTFDVTYYTHDLSIGVLPNDDLDLQLVFLCAAERFGRALTPQNLADYWMYGIPVDWSEYGTGRANIKFGFPPPVSGGFHNEFRNSCGCFIRSELWACLHPGHPELAVKYAYMDGVVDHADEGVFGEIFCAAIESAAFCEADTDKLIDIGLSYIPADCSVAGAVRLARETYADRRGWEQARHDILSAYPDTFGLMRSAPDPLIPRGELGFDVPGNIGLMVMAWLYGEGDFSKSICLAASCGEDSDCTAGTLASILGIIGGMAGFEERWLAPIGDEIKTCTVDCSKEDLPITHSVAQLTARIAHLMPTFLQGHLAIDGEGLITIHTPDDFAAVPRQTGWFVYTPYAQEIRDSFGMVTESCTAFKLGVSLDTYELIRGRDLTVTVELENLLRQQQWVTVKLLEVDGGKLTVCEERAVFVNNFTAGYSTAKTTFTLPFSTLSEPLSGGRHELLVIAESTGNVSRVCVPMVYVVN